MRSLAALLFVFMLQPVFSQPVSLSDIENQYDYVIITVPEFREACEQFKVHKENTGSFRILIADTSEIFREFDSSLIKQDNIRSFISYAGTFWRNPRPKYFLLAGDLNKIPNYEIVSVPGYEDTDTAESDFYFAVNKYKTDTNKVDFYVGRIAARNNTELNNYLNKLISYESSTVLSSWNNNVLIISDDKNTPSGSEGKIWEDISLDIGNNAPAYIKVHYFFEDDSSEYYGTKDSVVQFINSEGAAAVYFIGHGNSVQYTHEKYFTIDDVDLLDNGNKFFITFFMGSQYFSDTVSSSMTDQFLFSSDGAVGGINYVGMHYAFAASEVYKESIKSIFSQNRFTIGEAWETSIANEGIHFKKLINIFGDPSLKLKFDTFAPVEPPVKIVPDKYLLMQNFPNPFNPSTTIRFSLPEDGMVKMKVYNVLGREVSTIINKFFRAGEHSVDFNGADLSSGVYFYTIEVNNFTQTRKMILIK